MYITVDEAKKHLNIDSTFTEDDAYIEGLIGVAEDSVSKHLDIELEDLVVGGELPPAIKHSLLLMVGNLYANREPISYTTIAEIPYSYQYLIGLYKHYEIK